VRHRAPTDRALDLPLAALQAEFASLKTERRNSTRLIEGGAYSLNARYLTAGEPRDLVHKNVVELYFVREGSGTLVTGGKIVNNKIQGGTERIVKAGDVVFIPPGVPHGFSTTSGISWLNVHFAGTD
jgi:mannose-6-phosphate isomerase-like protein (cupin superfamily)